MVGQEWLNSHASIRGGKTVLEVNGEERTLPRADLSRIFRPVAS